MYQIWAINNRARFFDLIFIYIERKRNMRLKTKLFLGFASILAIMAVVFGISIHNLDLSNRNVDKAQQERYQKIKFANAVQDEINNISRYYRDLVLLDANSHEFLQTIDSIRSSRQKVVSGLDSL